MSRIPSVGPATPSKPDSTDPERRTTTLLKRKRAPVAQSPLLFDTFHIDSAKQAPLIVEPLICVLKTGIPLHCFDFAATGAGPSSAIFRTENAHLDRLLHGHAHSWLLVAQINHTSQLAAVECLATQLYSITYLRADISVSELTSKPRRISTRPRKFQKVEPSEHTLSSWWHTAALKHSVLSPSAIDTVKDGAGARQCLDPPKATSESVGASLNLDRSVGSVVIDASAPNVPTNPAQLLDVTMRTVVEQYLEALYLSKTSLAYFPKSTLSRARAAVLASTEGLGFMHAFASHLRGIVLSPSTFEKKYRRSLPDTIKSLSSVRETHDNNDASARPKRVNKLKKTKPGKNGLYSLEGSYIGRWLDSHEATSSQASYVDYAKHIHTELRFREILLQIIIVLEVFAIESSLPQSSTTNEDNHDHCTDVPGDGRLSAHSRRKPKKPLNLDNVLDMLVDRLCIWQSVEAAGWSEKTKDARASASEDSMTPAAPMGSDRLQDFYYHVLVPFYAARMRSKVETLAKRMGVSKQPSPLRARPLRIPAQVAPGTDIRRRQPQITKPGLQRQASQEGKAQPARPPSLARSATDSMLRLGAREESTTPLEGPMRPPRRTLSRASSISSSTKLSQREVDMTAIARYSQSKPKRKVSMDQELQQAIATLKKPNRTKAVAEYVNTLESQKSQTSAKPWLKSRLGVEVGATPRKEQKTKDAFLSAALQSQTGGDDADFPIPSTDPYAPSSGAGDLVPLSSNRPTSISNMKSISVFETPSRRATNHPLVVPASDKKGLGVGKNNGNAAITSKPTAQNPVLATPQKSRDTHRDAAYRSPTHQYYSDTERKTLTKQDYPVDTPAKDRISPMDQQEGAMRSVGNIYDTLGWNEDDCDELL